MMGNPMIRPDCIKMPFFNRWQRRFLCGLLCVASLSGCGVDQALRTSNRLQNDGDLEQSIAVLQKELKNNPGDIQLRSAIYHKTEALVSQLLRQSGEQLAQGNYEGAIAAMRTVLQYDPGNLGAQQEIARIQNFAQLNPRFQAAAALEKTQPSEALRQVEQILAEQPQYADALELRERLMRVLTPTAVSGPVMAGNLIKPVSLRLKGQSLANIFDLISRMSGIGFIFDKDVNTSAVTSIAAENTTAEDAINILLMTNQLEKRVLNGSTFLIYPARPEKHRDYRDLMMRVFYLSHADPRVVAAEIKQMIKPKEVFIEERLSAVIVRDSKDTMSVVERLVQALDLPQSEVSLDVQVLEVGRSDLLNLGIGYPESVTIEPSRDLISGGGIPIGALTRLNRDNLVVASANTAIKINMLQRSGNTQTLANPRIRVRNREKALISIGERVPVVTTTTANLVTSESISYQEVGLKLEVEPTISLSGEVSIKVSLDVSNIIKEVRTSTGNVAYVLGSRLAKTTLTARNNETQMLAGLIRRSDFQNNGGLPGLSRIPVLGSSLFGNTRNEQDQSEIVLLITPRIERNLDLPAAYAGAFMTGTETRTSADEVILKHTRNLHLTTAPGGGYGAGGTAANLPPPLSTPMNGSWTPLPPPVVNATPAIQPTPAANQAPAVLPPRQGNPPASGNMSDGLDSSNGVAAPPQNTGPAAGGNPQPNGGS